MVDKQIIITPIDKIPHDLNMEFKCNSKKFIINPEYNYNLVPGFREFIESVKDHKDWKPMKVAKKGRAIIDPAIRSSKINRSIYIHLYNERLNNSEEDIYKTNDEQVNNMVNIGGKNYNIGLGNIQLIRYDAGDHFDEFHQDTFKTSDNCNMIGTMLIFPPADISPFTGGDLVFQTPDPTNPEPIITTFEPSKLSQWSIVSFGRVMHKCTPVISGTRYVIKAEIWSEFPNIMIPNLDITIDMISSVIEKHTQPDMIHHKNSELIGMIKEQNYKIASKITDRIPGKKMVDSDMFDIDAVENPTNDDAIDAFIAEYKVAMRAVYLLQKEFNDNLKYSKLSKDSKIPSELEYTLTTEDKSYPMNIYVLSTEYEIPVMPDTISKWKLKHLSVIKSILEAGYKITFVNRLFETYKPALLSYESGNLEHTEKLYINKRSGDKINWIIENDREVGKLINTESTYNDESGYDIRNTYSSTCIAFFRETLREPTVFAHSLF
jgi:hypothetical protein